jgi:hypothetical protein
MTTEVSFGGFSSIHPSSVTVPLDDFSLNAFETIYLPNVLRTTVKPGYYFASGLIDLDFTLTVGSEVVSQVGTYDYLITNNTIGAPGTPGAVAILNLEMPIVFSSKAGTFSILASFGAINLLGAPIGAAQVGHLSATMKLTVPEPSSCVMLLPSLVIGCCLRFRLANSRREKP